jgi:hypothetical protein
MLPDDAFWAARRVAAFDDALIRALVHTGQFSDPAAEEHLAQVLIQRRDKIAKSYLTAVNPVVNPRLDPGGELTFDNAAMEAGVADVSTIYEARWSTGGASRGTRTSMRAPSTLPAGDGAVIQITITAEAQGYPEWRQPVTLHFRQQDGGWTLVGLDRGIGER